MPQIPARVVTIEEVMPDACLLRLECPPVAAGAHPGQFLMVRCGGETLLRRPLSIHRIDAAQGIIALLFHIVGKGTQWLAERKPGDTIDVLGPLGNGFTIQRTSKNLLLVAGGMGIAPLVFLAEKADSGGCSVKLLVGGPTATQILQCNFLPDTIDVIYASEDATLGTHGRVTILVPDYFAWANQIFACGPLPMYRNLAENFPQLKNKPVQVSLETRMACGLGLCYGCTVRTTGGLKQVCQDGPVFNLPEIIFDELF